MENVLAERIEERLKALGLSARGAAIRAGLHPDSIRSILRGKSLNPRSGAVAALARVLEVPLEYLTDAVGEAPPPLKRRWAAPLGTVFVRGVVQGGVWREAIEWAGSDWYALTVPEDSRWPGAERFGLEVRGSSMDRLYPEGTIVVCIRFGDIAREPMPGEKVVCLRRARTGEYEATIKEYQFDRGRHVLWPRSLDPEFQQPIILTGERMPMAPSRRLPTLADAGHDDGGSPDIVITALVTQSVRRE